MDSNRSLPARGLSAIGKSLSMDAMRSSATTIKDAATSVVPKDLLPSVLLSLGRAQNDSSSSGFSVGTVVTINSTPLRVVGVLAAGAHSQVFRCADRNGTEWALKRARCQSARSRKAAARELGILRSLPQADGLMQFHDSMTRPLDSGGVEVFFLLHLCRGGALIDKLARSGPDGLRPAEIYKCLADCGEALAALHTAQLVHFDLKLENILLADEGAGRAIIGDFGSTTQLADLGHGQLTIEEVIAEQERLHRDTTPAYRAPEVVRMLRAGDTVALTEKVDIWAIGCIVFALHFGRLPFNDNSAQFEGAVEAGAVGLTELAVEHGADADDGCGELPEPLRQVLVRCLATDPPSRPSATDLVSAAHAALSSAVGASWAAVATFGRSSRPSTPSGGQPVPRRTQSVGLRRLHLRLLDEAASRAENGCADCHADCPRWAALDFSVWVCYRCARLHRWLLPGTRLQPVGSDLWTSDAVEMMCKADGSINHEWEQIAVDSGATHPHTPASTPNATKNGTERYDVERWILAKYWMSYTERRHSYEKELEVAALPGSAGGVPLSNGGVPPTSTIRNHGYLTLYQPNVRKHKKQRQFFVLTDEVLAFFRSEEEGLATMGDLHLFHASVRANGVFDIGSVTDVSLVIEDEDGVEADSAAKQSRDTDDTATFKLCLIGRQGGEYLLEADDHATSLRWVQSIQTALLQVSTVHPRARSPSETTQQLQPAPGSEGYSESQLRLDEAEPAQATPSPMAGLDRQRQHQQAEDPALAFADDVADLEFEQYHTELSPCSVSGSSSIDSLFLAEGVPPRSIPSSLTAQLTASASQLERALAAVAGSPTLAEEPSTLVSMRAGLEAGLGRRVAEQTVVELLRMLGLDSSPGGSAVDRPTMAAALAAVNLGAGETVGAAETLPGTVAAGSPSTRPEQQQPGGTVSPPLAANEAPKASVAESAAKESWLLVFSEVDKSDRGCITRDDLLHAIAGGSLADCFPLGSDVELARVDEVFAAVFRRHARAVTAVEWCAAWERLSESVRRDIAGLLAAKSDLQWM